MNITAPANQNLAPLEKRDKDIIIVEDDNSIGNMLMEVVKQETPYQSTHVTTGRQALFLVPQLSPRLLLLDYRLPDMTGLEVYQQLRSHQELGPFSAILISAHCPTRLRDTPGLIYIQKPFEMDLLLLTMQQLMEAACASSS